MVQQGQSNSANSQQSQSAKPLAGFSAIEKLAGIILSNRFIWVILLIAWASVAHISYWQVRYPRFDTLELLSHLSVILEFALIIFVALILGGFPAVRLAWDKRYPAHRFSLVFCGIAGVLCIVVLYALLIAPVLYFHRYPELVEHDVRVPLMLLQRYMLVLLTALFSYNVGLVLRLYFRFPWSLSALFAVLSQIGVGYWVSWLSFTKENYARLNDVFYYNMLADRFEWFPALSQEMLFHNIEQAYFNHYFSIAAAVFVVSLLLWMPKAIAQSGSLK